MTRSDFKRVEGCRVVIDFNPVVGTTLVECIVAEVGKTTVCLDLINGSRRQWYEMATPSADWKETGNWRLMENFGPSSLPTEGEA